MHNCNMFEFFADLFDGNGRAERKAARESQERQRAYEAQMRAEAAEARQARIDAIRVFTGDLKHRYVVIDTLRGFGQYELPSSGDYDPTEATQRATYSLQVQAADMLADAVVHARFEVLRYTHQVQGRLVPVYEVHAFGTAVRVVGPPADLEEMRDAADSAYESSEQI